MAACELLLCLYGLTTYLGTVLVFRKWYGPRSGKVEKMLAIPICHIPVRSDVTWRHLVTHEYCEGRGIHGIGINIDIMR